MTSIKFCDVFDCLISLLAKQTHSQYLLSTIHTHAPFELIHVNIWGRYHISALGEARYFLTIADDYTRCPWVYLMHHKSDTPTYITAFINFVETKFTLKVKIFRSDNSLKFTMKSFYLDKGIIHQTSYVSSPQQNGVAERKHSHLLNVWHDLYYFKLIYPRNFGICHLTAAYLINRTPTPLLKGKTPFDMLFHKQPTYDHLPVF